MKKIICLMMLCAAFVTANAQENERGFKWFLDGQINGYGNLQVGGGAIAGYNFGQHFFLGLGADILYVTNNDCVTPIYLNTRFSLKDTPETSVIDVRVGLEQDKFLSASYGYRIPLNKTTITPLIGLKFVDGYTALTTGITFEF